MLGNNLESRHTHRVFPTSQLQFLNVAILFEEPFEFFVVSIALFEAATLRQVQMSPNHWVRSCHIFPFLAYPLSSHQERHRAIIIRTIPENSFPNFLFQFLPTGLELGFGLGFFNFGRRGYRFFFDGRKGRRRRRFNGGHFRFDLHGFRFDFRRFCFEDRGWRIVGRRRQGANLAGTVRTGFTRPSDFAQVASTGVRQGRLEGTGGLRRDSRRQWGLQIFSHRRRGRGHGQRTSPRGRGHHGMLLRLLRCLWHVVVHWAGHATVLEAGGGSGVANGRHGVMH